MITPVRMDAAEDLEWQYRKEWTLSDFQHWRVLRDPLQEWRSYEGRRQRNTGENLQAGEGTRGLAESVTAEVTL